MHSMVGAFTPYTRKQHQNGTVRGYCYRFLACSFPCGIVMLILSSILILLGMILLIYIFHFDGCGTINPTDKGSDSIDIISISSLAIKCNRQAMKVLGITFIVSGAVLLSISLVVIKYSRSSEENNVIRATKSSLRANNTKQQQQSHQRNFSNPTSSSEHEQNQMIVSIR
ncbi:hypothetical protein I4U23_000323 [Adineta vaga]|nr:hypothetical protein I4U23_000323 [Adineta vaga]